MAARNGERERLRRGVLSLVIGTVAALLLAAASQFMLVPLLAGAQPSTLRVVAPVVFWGVFVGVLLLVIVAVLRGRRHVQ